MQAYVKVSLWASLRVAPRPDARTTTTASGRNNLYIAPNMLCYLLPTLKKTNKVCALCYSYNNYIQIVTRMNN